MEKPEIVNKSKARAMIVSSHRGRGRTDAEMTRDYAEYNVRKKIVFDAEKRNFRHLVFFLASDGKIREKNDRFYNMGGNSALIYISDIAPRIGRKNVRINPDRDATDVRFRDGMVVVKNVNVLIGKMLEIGIGKLEKQSNEQIVYFKLNRKYEDSEIKQMKKTIEEDKKRMNEILYAEVVYPDIYKKLINLRKSMYFKMKCIRRDDREILQDKILDPMFRLSDLYTMMAHGDEKPEDMLVEMQKTLDVMMDRLLFISDIELITVATAASLGMTMAEMKKDIREKMEKIKNETKK